MTVSVTMLQSRWGEDGTLWAVDTVHDSTDSFATFLVTNGFASGTLPLPLQSTPVSHVILTAAEIAALDGEPGWTYEDRDTGVVYRADRSGNLAAQAGTVNVGGIEYLTLSDGSRLPLSIMAGTPHEPMVAATLEQTFTIDSGNDSNDHVELLITPNATTGGNPDGENTDLASARFSLPDGNALVLKTLVTGASPGPTLTFSGPITMMHFALRGAGPYTQAAANVCTALQMVLMKWVSTLAVNVVEVRIGTSYDLNGLQVGAKRYRKVTVTGYSA